MGSWARPWEWGIAGHILATTTTRVQYLPAMHDSIGVEHWHHLEHKLVPQVLSSWVVTHQQLKDSCIQNIVRIMWEDVHIVWHVSLKCGLKTMSEIIEVGTFHHPAWVWLPGMNTTGEHNILPVFHIWIHNVMRKWVTYSTNIHPTLYRVQLTWLNQ